MIRSHCAVLILVALLGCGHEPANEALPEPEAPRPVGEILAGARFVSVEKREIGLGEDGPVLGHWSITFRDGLLVWNHSDVQQSLPYRVTPDERITARGLEGSFDRETGTLTWAGLVYERRLDAE